MTVKDSSIIVQVNTDMLVLIGDPDGYVITSTDAMLRDKFNRNIRTGAMVPIIPGEPHKLFPAGDTTMMGLVTAMLGVNPGEAILVEAPERVWAVLTPENLGNVPGQVN